MSELAFLGFLTTNRVGVGRATGARSMQYEAFRNVVSTACLHDRSKILNNTISQSLNIKIKAEIFQEEFDKGERLQEFVLRYLNVMITQISQSSICHKFHTIEQTLSRWLMTVHDQVHSNTLYLTQQVIAQALGVPRTGITVAAGALQTAGAIRYSRGKIVILDRTKLESRSCECYRIISDELDHFLNE